jgi:hypothetical protein
VKIDDKNINAFEATSVMVAFLCIVLMGLTLFSTMPSRLQSQVLAAITILDMHEQVSQSFEPVRFAVEVENRFLDEFYIAFVQLTVPPPSATEAADEIKSTAQDVIKRELLLTFDTLNSFIPERIETSVLASASSPQVAGALVDSGFANSPPQPGCDPPSKDAESFSYTYKPPQWEALTEKIINIWSN